MIGLRHGEKPSTSLIQGRLKTSPKRLRVSRVIQLPGWPAEVNSYSMTSDTLLNNYMFDGARADLSKSLSMNPGFNVTHSFTLGSQTAPPAYHFGAIFANEKVRTLAQVLAFLLCQQMILTHASQLFLHGNVDNDGNMSGRFNQGWSANNVTKAQAQVWPFLPSVALVLGHVSVVPLSQVHAS